MIETQYYSMMRLYILAISLEYLIYILKEVMLKDILQMEYENKFDFILFHVKSQEGHKD